MKKIISMILSAIMIVTLFTACNEDKPDETFMADLTVEEAAILFGESFVKLDSETISVMFYDDTKYSDAEDAYANMVNMYENVLEYNEFDLAEVADEISFEYIVEENISFK